MKFCGKCGNQISLTQKFCNKCGAPNQYYTAPGADTPADADREAAEKRAKEEQQQREREARQQAEAGRRIQEAREKEEAKRSEEAKKIEEERRAEEERKSKEAKEQSERYEQELLAAQKQKLEKLAEEKAAKEKEQRQTIEQQRNQIEMEELRKVKDARQKLIEELAELEALAKKREELLSVPTPAAASARSEEPPARASKGSKGWIIGLLVIVCLLAGSGFFYYPFLKEYFAKDKPAMSAGAASPIMTDTTISAAHGTDSPASPAPVAMAAKAAAPAPVSPVAVRAIAATVKARDIAKKTDKPEADVPDAIIKKDLMGKRLSTDWTFHNQGEIIAFSKSHTDKISDTEIKYELVMGLQSSSGQQYTAKVGVSYALTGGAWQMNAAPVLHYFDEK